MLVLSIINGRNCKWSYLPQKNDWDQKFLGYLIILRDASLQPIFKGHSLLFTLASCLISKSAVYGYEIQYRTNILITTGGFSIRGIKS